MIVPLKYSLCFPAKSKLFWIASICASSSSNALYRRFQIGYPDENIGTLATYERDDWFITTNPAK